MMLTLSWRWSYPDLVDRLVKPEIELKVPSEFASSRVDTILLLNDPSSELVQDKKEPLTVCGQGVVIKGRGGVRKLSRSTLISGKRSTAWPDRRGARHSDGRREALPFQQGLWYVPSGKKAF